MSRLTSHELRERWQALNRAWLDLDWVRREIPELETLLSRGHGDIARAKYTVEVRIEEAERREGRA